MKDPKLLMSRRKNPLAPGLICLMRDNHWLNYFSPSWAKLILLLIMKTMAGYIVQGGILSGSAAALLTETFCNWTEILVENHAFLSHFGLESDNLSFWTEINLFKNRKQKRSPEIFSGLEHINFEQKLILPKKDKFFPE